MSTSVETILLYTIGAGFLSIVYGFFTGKNILNQSAGNAKMQEIASAIQIGAKAYLVEEEPNSSIRGNSMIYSGIYNSRTGINRTNVFSVGDNIVKSVDPANGSIQKLYAEDTNLNIFQELKINRALIDKDAIYSAEGGGTVTSSNLVIGAIQPYPGKYGISRDPQSFAVYGTAKYFSDKNNNVILRLAGGQLQEISAANMIDYFRDRLGTDINIAGVPGKIIGGWDIYNKQYVISTQESGADEFSFERGYETLTWDENIKGWTSFFTYKPDHNRSEHFKGDRNIHAYFDTVIDSEAYLGSVAGGSDRYLSEDYFFCQFSRKIGYQIFLCPWMELGHMGSYVFSGSMASLANLEFASHGSDNQKVSNHAKRRKNNKKKKRK
jgi:hypothetical protein